MPGTDDALRLGFVGVGAMGAPMAANLMKRWSRLAVYDIVPERVQAVVKQGARAAASAAEVARQADVVVTMVPRTEHLEQAVFGASGLAEGMGAGQVLIDCSTVSPTRTREIAERLGRQGVAMIDAPVVTSQRPDRHPMPALDAGTVNIGVASATYANLCFLVGGEPAVVERCRPILEAMGIEVRHVGGIGCGQVCKVINNTIVGSTVVLAAEMLVLGVKAGIDPTVLVDCLVNGSATSQVMKSHVKQFMVPHAFPRGLFSVDYMHKDVTLAVDLARDLHSPLFIPNVVKQIFEAADAAGWRDDYNPIVVKIFERLANVEWPKPPR
jgi:3-hydroxyisobutyrate dehydrogenase-like beta-hydroxyacid dehydrogenase